MKILGIETSCDETAAAVIEDGTKILSNVVASSASLHVKTGGVIPEQAARQQVKSILPVVQYALSDAKSQMSEIDAVAVTVGPGLVGSLLVGVETAKTLAWVFSKPIIPVNHLIGHIYANFIRENSNVKTQMSKLPEFPALALVVSGGHTDIVLMKDHGQIRWIGGTRDDAAGECFDKCARILGLPYPGGPAIAAEAEKFQFSPAKRTKYPNFQLNMFPRPMINDDNFDFSFSGLKTSVVRQLSNEHIKKLGIPRIAAEIQEAIVKVLVEKTIKVVKKFKPKSLLLAGGVAANSRLRELFKLKIENCKLKINLFVPPPQLCTDNATYIASCAYFNYQPKNWKEINVNPQLKIFDQV